MEKKGATSNFIEIAIGIGIEIGPAALDLARLLMGARATRRTRH